MSEVEIQAKGSGSENYLPDEATLKTFFESYWPYSQATGSVYWKPISLNPTTGTVWSVSEKDEAKRLIKEIQDKLSLTIGEISKLLAVSRQAVHSWMRGGAISPTKRKNLEQLHEWAQIWAEKSGNQFPDTSSWFPIRGESILNIIAKEGASSPEGKRAWEAFMAEQLETLERRAKIPSAKEILERMGASMPSEEGQERTLRRNLGRI